ncbi:hypothetical protein B0F90DRAFT_211033 [Multifurca ochricompacta]|uniref:Uncharacterized protein n=1 Tax=Multifurca ochricompacta TaxID=376703 RepID=A0AAD4M537_9AGAM|nr:hypothetical protein B0F90DRAFT_211033 [Multifurca ochricompacta]
MSTTTAFSSSSTASTTVIPTTSSSTQSSSPSPPPRPSFFSGNASPPLIIGFISIGALALAVISLCAWRRLASRDDGQLFPVRHLNGRRRRSELVSGKPELFDAWTEWRTTDIQKWGDVKPFSATVFTDVKTKRTSESLLGTGDHRGHSAQEGKDRDKQNLQDCDLQIAVLLAMPSPSPVKVHNSVGRQRPGSPFRDELAIGLIEVPWTREYLHSPETLS